MKLRPLDKVRADQVRAVKQMHKELSAVRAKHQKILNKLFRLEELMLKKRSSP